MNKKIIIALGIIVGAVYAIGNAAMVLRFPDLNIQSFGNKFSLVHFVAPGNNFVGSIFRLPSKSIPPMTIHLNPDNKKCTKQIRGLYFNSQRGNRLRPLDSETLTLLQQQNGSYSGLHMQGGLYTTCENDPYSIYGYITYVRKGITGHIVAGTQLNYLQNKITAAFAKSLQYFDNKVVIGYIYDSNGGIGYVGGSLSGDQNLINFLNNNGSINDAFMYSGDTIVSSHPNDRITTIESGNNAMETMWNLIIQGSVGLSKSIYEAERLSLLGNFQNKTVIYNGSDINSSTLINFAKQKAQELCQGKGFYTNNILGTTEENIICIQGHDLTINLNTQEIYQDKTIIVRNGNVILQGGMQEGSPSLDLFIDKGLLYLPSIITWQTFDDQGFPSSINSVSSGLYLKGNFIVNGLIVGGVPSYETGFDHKLHLQGKVTTLNTPIEPTAGRTDQVETIIGNGYADFISLQKVFTRICGFNGRGSDGTQCTTGGVISTTPLVILNGNYPSNILQ